IRELTTHTAHQTHITSMHTFVDLTTHNEQCSRRQTASQHHDHQTLEGQDITCIKRQEYEAHVRNRGVGQQTFHICLLECTPGTVEDTNQTQNNREVCKLCRSCREEWNHKTK